MNIFLKSTLFFVLVSLFISVNVFADSPNDLLKRKEIIIDNPHDINPILEHSKNTTGVGFMSIILPEQESTYIKVATDKFFRVVDSSVELISISDNSDNILWKKDFNDLFLPKIIVKNDYLIVSGEFFSYDVDFFKELNLSKPVSISKVFDISNLDKILLSNEFMLPGSFKDCVPTDNSIILFSDFIGGADSTVRFPYYVEGREKKNFSLDNLMKMKDSNSPSYINALKISLLGSPKVSDHRSLLGFGSTLSSSEDNLFIRSTEDGVTRISKLNLNMDWFSDNYSISLPGVINSDSSFNIFNGNIQVTTSLLSNDTETFNVYSLDENLNLKDSFTKFGNGFIQEVYPLNNKLLINYSSSYESEQENWVNFQFGADYSLKTLPLDNFKYANTFITDKYMFSFENRDSNNIRLLIRDLSLELVSSTSITTNNFIFPSSHLISCNVSNNILAIPVVLNSNGSSHGMLIFRNYHSSKLSTTLISAKNVNVNDYSLDNTPEKLEFIDDKLYAISKSSIFVYDLSTNEIIKRISLK